MRFKAFFFKLTILWVCAVLSFSAVAKKNEFQLSAKKYKPQNQKLIKKIWSASLKPGKPSKRYAPEASSPVLHDGVIYLGTHGKRFYAINAASGKVIWQYKNEEPIASTAVVGNGRVYFTDLGGRVLALDTDSGNLVWQREFDEELLGRPVLEGGKLILVKGEREILALSPESGEILWHETIPTFVRDLTMRGHADVVAENGRVYVGLSDGGLYALNAANGAVLWNHSLSVPLTTFKDIDGAIALVQNDLLVGGYFGQLYRMGRDSGKIQWSTPVVSGVAPLVVAGVVVVSNHSDGSLDGFDFASGKKLWSNEANGSVLSAPVQLGAFVFVTSDEGEAYLFDPVTGQQKQHMNVSGGAITGPLSDGNAVYVLTNTANLVAFAIQ